MNFFLNFYVNHLGRFNPHLNTRWLQQHDSPHYTSTVSDLLATQLATILYCHLPTRTTEGIFNSGHPVVLILTIVYIQCDSFGTRPKKMRISQRLFIRF